VLGAAGGPPDPPGDDPQKTPWPVRQAHAEKSHQRGLPNFATRGRDGPPEVGRRSLDLDQFTLVRVSLADGAAHSVVSKGDPRMRPVPPHRSQAAG
jgi:hypothetical protein